MASRPPAPSPSPHTASSATTALGVQLGSWLRPAQCASPGGEFWGTLGNRIGGGWGEGGEGSRRHPPPPRRLLQAFPCQRRLPVPAPDCEPRDPTLPAPTRPPALSYLRRPRHWAPSSGARAGHRVSHATGAGRQASGELGWAGLGSGVSSVNDPMGKGCLCHLLGVSRKGLPAFQPNSFYRESRMLVSRFIGEKTQAPDIIPPACSQ